MKNYLKEEPTRNYDYAEAGGKPYIIIRNKDGSTTKLLIDKNAKYYNDLKRDVERSGTNFNKLRDDFIRRKEAQANSEPQSPKPQSPKPQSPEQKPQLADIRGGDGKTQYGDGTPIETKKEPEPPKEKPQQEPPKEKPQQETPKPKPKLTVQQKAGLPSSVPAASVPDVVKYQKARQDAIATSDPVEKASKMAKVRNDGMAIWAKLYGPGGKKELKYPSAQQKDIFDKYSSNKTNQGSSGTLTSSQKTEILRRGAEARQSIEKEAQRRGIPKMTNQEVLRKTGAEVKFESTNIAKEPYDLILEYLLENGHADTIDEANYIMLKLDSQSIQTIVEMGMPDPIDPMKHKAAQKTQKIYNKAKGGAGSEKDFLKRTGPQLPGV